MFEWAILATRDWCLANDYYLSVESCISCI
jgi:hypothetical protein